jgi:hypothetical protein
MYPLVGQVLSPIITTVSINVLSQEYHRKKLYNHAAITYWPTLGPIIIYAVQTCAWGVTSNKNPLDQTLEETVQKYGELDVFICALVDL